MTASSPASIELQQRIDEYLHGAGLSDRGPSPTAVTGDASDRRYVRVRFRDGTSIMLAVHVGPIEFASLPFANVWGLLREIPLPVPNILGHSDRLGIIALEDLGDLTLQEHLRNADMAQRTALYREAITFIERLQRRGDALASNKYVPYGVAFDVEKLTWELNYFLRHFVEGFRGVRLEPSERLALAEEFATLASGLAAEPRVVCHRDYHSRNLMLHDGRLFVIDFQDARMGPDTYDLVSLLHDAYVEITSEEREAHIDRVVAGMGSADPHAFRRRFNVMTVQRTLKALGTFGYQATVRHNPVYLQYVPRTAGYARDAMANDERFARLRGILGRHVPELRCS